MKGKISLLSNYSVSILCVGIALVLTFLLQPFLDRSIFLIFFAAIAVSTWYGGIKPGLLATVLSVITVRYFFIDPQFSFSVENPDSIIKLGLFTLVTMFISWLNSELRTSKQKLEISFKHLAASEARFRRLKDANIIGVIISDIKGGILEANDAFLNMVGYTREELLAGRINCRKMTPPEYLEKSDRSILELRNQRVCQPFEKQYIRKDGSRVSVLLGLALLEDNSDQVIGFVVDVSERKKAEDSLRKQEEQLRLITDSLPVQISYVDAQQRYRFNNKRYEEWFGIPTSQMDGKHLKEILGDSVYEKIYSYVETVLSGKQVTYENKLLHPDGTEHNTSVTYVPQFNNQGKVEGFVALIRDITEQKQAEQEREQLLKREQAARTEAETANRIKDEFLATLSHELRTPLNAMLGWTQLLRSRKFDEATTARALETIDRNSRSLAQLIEDVLDVSRIIRGKLRLNMRQVELVPVVEAAIDTVRPAADAKHICIESEFDPAVGVVIGDANRLQQIVWNLLSNAVKFTPKEGIVQVKIQRIKSRVQIQVSDTGAGIAPEFLPYVFERFCQADSSTTRSHGGLGLGLAIVRHLAEMHGGTVFATSPGLEKGATFIVNLPMKAVINEDDTPKSQPFLTNSESVNYQLSILENVRVLVVDDEADTRNLLTTILGQYGAQVTAVASTQEAMTALSQFHPDILISDIGMPGEDGYTLIRKVRSLPINEGGKIPAVALTAYARSEDRTQALLAGFQLHIPKPVNAGELAAVVANLAGRT